MAVLWRQHHNLNERAQPVERLRLQRFVLEGRGELFDLLTVHAAQVRGKQIGLRGNRLCGFLFGKLQFGE
ncbi:hypothetical protein ASE82_18320 [Sphingomonas sp. Leaf230]|uniref:hypothetical protein n=1 Tax=Sphingomonas sp. Leaf230 TaxID=1735694 RepID=UPI0006F46E92|nr:hypothetical protein [Sphingomonas sp. Leaf230]KQN04323.1 hypothetical protein ASE82_18320 [Sphingomonas sp. Leaf230]